MIAPSLPPEFPPLCGRTLRTSAGTIPVLLLALLTLVFAMPVRAQVDSAAVVFQRKLEKVPIESFQVEGEPLPDAVRKLQDLITQTHPDVPINFMIPPELNKNPPMVYSMASGSNAWDVLQMISSSASVTFRIQGKVVIFEVPERVSTSESRSRAASATTPVPATAVEDLARSESGESSASGPDNGEKIVKTPLLLPRWDRPIINAELDIAGARIHGREGVISESSVRVRGQDSQGKPVQTELRSIALPAAIVAKHLSPIPSIFSHGIVASDYTTLKGWENPAFESGELPFNEIAKQVNPEAPFAQVRPGFMLLHMNWKTSREVAGAELITPIQGRSFVAISPDSFTALTDKWWNKSGVPPIKIPISGPGQFHEVPPEKFWVLKNPFDPDSPILSNQRGEMKKAWLAVGDPKFGPTAIVQTDLGFFLGCMDIDNPLAADQFTWLQATSSTTTPFILKKGQSRRIQKPEKLFALLDRNSQSRGSTAQDLLQRAIVRGQDLGVLLTRGLEAMADGLGAPVGDGVEPVGDADTGGGGSTASGAGGSFTERKIERVTLVIESWNAASMKFKLDIQQERREIEYSYKKGVQTIDSTPWKPERIMDFVEIPTDPDGGLRLWNGQKIIDLSPDSFGSLNFTEWAAVQQALRR